MNWREEICTDLKQSIGALRVTKKYVTLNSRIIMWPLKDT